MILCLFEADTELAPFIAILGQVGSNRESKDFELSSLLSTSLLIQLYYEHLQYLTGLRNVSPAEQQLYGTDVFKQNHVGADCGTILPVQQVSSVACLRKLRACDSRSYFRHVQSSLFNGIPIANKALAQDNCEAVTFF